MIIKVATTDDANALFELNSLFNNNADIESIRNSLAESDVEVVCIAYINDIAVGFCSGIIVKSMLYCEQRAEIEALYVREGFRKQGVGEALMNYLEMELIKYGVHHFHISTYDTNRNAKLLYEKCGYAKTGEILLDKTVNSK